MYRTGEYKPEEYEKELEEAGLKINLYDYSALYKEKNEKLDKLIEEYNNKLDELNKNSVISL